MLRWAFRIDGFIDLCLPTRSAIAARKCEFSPVASALAIPFKPALSGQVRLVSLIEWYLV
jgi:hypothetical protein